ncbi:NUMOD4 domain-containing protein [Nocardia brasiliensis]|uniref:NUMOD4 domain-containing protein n=1 Tax=Nocardia brasiliensis TaxID=37326 RepID=UPI002456C81B|nr:NUMOD4 domain-containing protein [Nocardia brasiliensis]
MIEESWKWIPGYEGLYKASTTGRIRSFHQKNPRVMQPARLPKGYRTVTLRRDGVPKTHLVHRLVARTFLGEPPSVGFEVCHNDGNAENNQLSNLRWDTASNNNRDKLVHGTNWQANKTHCPQGHEYTEDNTRVLRTGGRRCVRCKKDDSNRRYRAGRGELFGTHKGKKLTPEVIQEMKRLREDSGLLYREIAELYSVSIPTARLAIQGISYRDAA